MTVINFQACLVKCNIIRDGDREMEKQDFFYTIRMSRIFLSKKILKVVNVKREGGKNSKGEVVSVGCFNKIINRKWGSYLSLSCTFLLDGPHNPTTPPAA